MKVLIVSGFLGAGKTSFIRHMTDTLLDVDFVIFENEIGETDIDVKVLQEGERSLNVYEMTENKVARYLVIEEAGEIMAFAGAHIILDQAHVTNIAVRQDCRGRGLGRMITRALMQYASNLGAEYLTLEVRQSNVTAQNLYKSLGFVKVNVRKRYYEDTGEDAWLMVCDRLPPADPDFEEDETSES